MPAPKNWFQRRHYEFLVNWAASNIKPVQVATLADLLQVDNPRFDRKRFLKTYVELRRFARLHETSGSIVNWIAEQRLAPGAMTESDIRRRFNEAADAIVEAELEQGRGIAAKLVIGMPLKPSAEAVQPRDAILGPKHGQPHSTPSMVVPAPFPAPRIPRANMDAYLRKHAEANAGRGMWEYTRCWKCDDGRQPGHCPVACKGACEYPSAVND